MRLMTVIEKLKDGTLIEWKVVPTSIDRFRKAENGKAEIQMISNDVIVSEEDYDKIVSRLDGCLK